MLPENGWKDGQISLDWYNIIKSLKKNSVIVRFNSNLSEIVNNRSSQALTTSIQQINQIFTHHPSDEKQPNTLEKENSLMI